MSQQQQYQQPWSLHQLDHDEDQDSSTVFGVIDRARRWRERKGTKSTSTSANNEQEVYLPKITYSKCVRGGGRYQKNVRRFGSFDNLLVPNPDDDDLSESISLNDYNDNTTNTNKLRRSASNQDIVTIAFA
jgi:hypothetical protein